jgi:hypothetical protein
MLQVESGVQVGVMETEIANNLLGSYGPDHGVEAGDGFTHADIPNQF